VRDVDDPDVDRAEPGARPPSYGEALRAWTYVGLNSFGGPAGQIAVMHREIVERRGWIDERRFLAALNYCMLLPGPEAQQLATYIGWLVHGVRGGLAAGLLFVLPGVLVLLALSLVYALYQQTDVLAAVFYGIKPAVVALVAVAMLSLARRAINDRLSAAIAVGAFVALFFFDVPFPLIIIAAALAGVAAHRRTGGGAGGPQPNPGTRRPPMRPALRTVAVGLVVWLTPVVACVALLGPGHVLTQLALFFSFAAVITFGGAYAVLAFVAQQAVDVYGWLSPRQMLDGLGLAETTPGPLILVVQFVGFLAAFGGAAGMDPVAAGIAGALLVSWVTFAPSFIWIFGGAPYVEYLNGRPSLTAALAGITPAVVGVILNLASWFALQTFFGTTGDLRVGPLRMHTVELATIDVFAIGLAAAAFVALTRFKAPLLLVLLASAVLGAAAYALLPR
jgi:chromate transporter